MIQCASLVCALTNALRRFKIMLVLGLFLMSSSSFAAPKQPAPSSFKCDQKDSHKKGLCQKGFCKKEDIVKRVGGKQRSIIRCYEKVLLSNPELSGKVKIEFTIGLDGQVVPAKTQVISSTLDSDRVTACIARVINKIRFPKPEGGECVIRFPFVFNFGL